MSLSLSSDSMIVNLSLMCRICVSDCVDGAIDILNPGPDLDKMELLESIYNYFEIKINTNDGKSSKLCLRCLRKISDWQEDKKNAAKCQIVVDFLAGRMNSSSNFRAELPTNSSIDYDVINNKSTGADNSIVAINPTNSKKNQKKISCPFCNTQKKFSHVDQNSFCKKHSNPYTCLVADCYFVFPKKEVLIPHYRSHLGLKKDNYLCRQCIHILNCSRNVSHSNHKHKSLTQLLVCCGQWFPTMMELVCHKFIVHDALIITSFSQIKDLKFTKPNTGVLNQNLKRTINSQSLKSTKIVVKTKKEETDNKSLTGKYFCKICPSWFITVKGFVDHLKFKHNDTLATKEQGIQYCPMCEENYDTSKFIDHIDKCTSSMKVGDVSNDQYGCIFCTKVFCSTSASLFRNHFNFCKSFEVIGVDDCSSKVNRKCKNCAFESDDVFTCILHANAYCIHYKLKMNYASLPWEKKTVTRRIIAQERMKEDNFIFVKTEKVDDEVPVITNTRSFCDWTRQKLLESYMFYCNLCNKRFFNMDVFRFHLNSDETRCRPDSLYYCVKCLCDFESKVEYDAHLPTPAPRSPPSAVEIKVESNDFEFNGATDFYNEENLIISNTLDYGLNDQQFDDNNQEIKVFGGNGSTLFQGSEVSHPDINDTLLVEDSKDFSILYQEMEVSNDDLQCDVEVVEDKPDLNLMLENMDTS